MGEDFLLTHISKTIFSFLVYSILASLVVINKNSEGSLNKIPSKSSKESSKQQYFQKLNPVREEKVSLCQGLSLGNYNLNKQCIPVKKQTHTSFKMI